MNRNKTPWIVGLLFWSIALQAQEKVQDKAAQKAVAASRALTAEANQELKANDFITAEATYRKAIAKSNDNLAAPFNLGNAYYNRESFGEAFERYKQAAKTAQDKPEKHKAYHNLGNALMKNQAYAQAVEAYKEALRNNPHDNETRYNLALAQKMAEQQQNKAQNDNKDNKDNKNNNEQKEQQDQQNQQPEDDTPKPNDGEQNQEKEKQGDQGENNPDRQQKEGKEEPKPQFQPDQLSQQQIKNLLEAMQNEEKKVQEKIDAQKVRGQKIKNEKDW